MPIKTQVNGRAIRSSRSQTHTAKWTQIMRTCLEQKLLDLDRQSQQIALDKARVEALIMGLPPITDTTKETQ